MSKPNGSKAFALFVWALASLSVSAADIPSGGAVTLEQVVRIAIKNAPSIMIAGIQVDLAGADQSEAADPFGAVFKVGLASENVRGYEYPTELKQLSPLLPVPSTFLADSQNNKQLTSGLSKLFRSGIFTEFSISTASSSNAKTNADFLPIPIALNATGLKPGALASNYIPVHPSSIQLTMNFPLMKFSGENNIAAANERQKIYQREAAEMTLKHSVAVIIQNVVNAYWNFKAAIAKLNFTQESATQVERWLQKIEKESAGGGAVRSRTEESLSYLRGFSRQLVGDVSKAQEAVSSARNVLAQAIGIPSDDARKIAQATNDYPLDWSGVLASFNADGLRSRWGMMAEQNRFDMKAKKLEVDGADAISLGAQNDVKPKLDLAIILKRQGLSGGGTNQLDTNSFTTGTSPLGSAALLSFEYKLDNDKAKAQVVRTRYLKMQKEVEFNDVKRGLALGVDTVVNAVYNSLIGLRSAQQQSTLYALALDGMIKDDSIPSGREFDLVVIEQARLKAFIENVTALQTLSTAVTAANFQTGNLLKSADNIQEVVLSDLTRLP